MIHAINLLTSEQSTALNSRYSPVTLSQLQQPVQSHRLTLKPSCIRTLRQIPPLTARHPSQATFKNPFNAKKSHLLIVSSATLRIHSYSSSFFTQRHKRPIEPWRLAAAHSSNSPSSGTAPPPLSGCKPRKYTCCLGQKKSCPARDGQPDESKIRPLVAEQSQP